MTATMMLPMRIGWDDVDDDNDALLFDDDVHDMCCSYSVATFSYRCNCCECFWWTVFLMLSQLRPKHELEMP